MGGLLLRYFGSRLFELDRPVIFGFGRTADLAYSRKTKANSHHPEPYARCPVSY